MKTNTNTDLYISYDYTQNIFDVKYVSDLSVKEMLAQNGFIEQYFKFHFSSGIKVDKIIELCIFCDMSGINLYYDICTFDGLNIFGGVIDDYDDIVNALEKTGKEWDD